MTTLLRKAFDEIGKLTPPEQDLWASRLLAELDPEDEFDRHIERTAPRLASLAREALAEHRAGDTLDLNPDRL